MTRELDAQVAQALDALHSQYGYQSGPQLRLESAALKAAFEKTPPLEQAALKCAFLTFKERLGHHPSGLGWWGFLELVMKLEGAGMLK